MTAMKQNICKSFLNYFSLMSFLVAFLTACGGGSDDKPKITIPVQQSAKGVWYGEYTSPDGVTSPAQGLMNDGNFVLTHTGDETNYSIGSYTTILSNITLSSINYEYGTPSRKGARSLDGVVYSKGTMLLDSLEGGQYSLVYSFEQTETPISIEMLEGSLTLYTGNDLIRVFVDSSGKIFNDDSFNCDFSGDIKIPDNQNNILVIDLVIFGDNCIYRGVYSGLGAFLVDLNEEDLFTVYFHNGAYGFMAINNINRWLELL